MKYADQYNQSKFAKSSAEIRNKITASTTFGKQQELRSSRINSSTTTNIKSKVNLYEAIINQFETEVKALVEDTQQSHKFLDFLKRDLPVMKLADTKDKCLVSIANLEKFIKQQNNAQKNRTQQLKEKCDQLLEQKEMLKSKFFEARKRIQSLENAMGYYNGHEKHKS